MAMNKTEKAEFEAFKLERDMARALRWPHYSKPAPMTKAEIEMETGGSPSKVARGWFHNAYSGRVTYGCSNGYTHNSSGDKTTSQYMGMMFRWKSDALKLMRIEMTEKFAKQLAEVDRQIDEALATEGGE